MVRFLRELVAIPSESGNEKTVIQRIKSEMRSTQAFDRIWIDKMGNLFGQIGKPGKNKKLLAIDAHIDTVGIGDPAEWKFNPYKGKLENGKVWGRGAGDQKGAVPAMVYAPKIMQDLKLDLNQYCLLIVFTVMEEDCDGLCWQYIINENKIKPDAVVITDSTNCNILRGHRGRMEIGVTFNGKSCHGSMPHKGTNAVYKAARVITEIEKLNDSLATDPFLGKGTITVSYIDCKTPSLCAVPGQAYIHIDRRLTLGETKKSAVSQIKNAIKNAGIKNAKVQILRYAKPSYTGLIYETEKYFPTWCLPVEALPIQAAIKTYRQTIGATPTVHRWTFSTNAVSIAGMYNIPCVGFGPAPENVAHTVNDSVPIKQIIKCAAFYAGFGQAYCDLTNKNIVNQTSMKYQTIKQTKLIN